MPFKNEHACSLDGSSFKEYKRVNSSGHSPDKVFGMGKGGKTKLASLRYPVDKFSEHSASSSCKRNGGQFEPAILTKKKKKQLSTLNLHDRFCDKELITDINNKEPVKVNSSSVEFYQNGSDAEKKVVLIKSGLTAHSIGGREENNIKYNVLYKGDTLKRNVAIFEDIPMFMDHPDRSFLNGRPRKSDELAGWYDGVEFVRTPDRDSDFDKSSGAIIAKPNFLGENGRFVEEVMSKKPSMLEISIVHTGDFEENQLLGFSECSDMDWCISADIVPLGAAGGNLTGETNESVISSNEADEGVSARPSQKNEKGANKDMNIDELKGALSGVQELRSFIEPQIRSELEAEIRVQVQTELQSKVDEQVTAKLKECSVSEMSRIRNIAKAINDSGLPESFADTVFCQAVENGFDIERTNTVITSTHDAIKQLNPQNAAGVATRTLTEENVDSSTTNETSGIDLSVFTNDISKGLFKGEEE